MKRWLLGSWHNGGYFLLRCVAWAGSSQNTGHTVLWHSAVCHSHWARSPCLYSGVCPFILPFWVLKPRLCSWSPLFSVILESWMGTLYCLWIKRQPFSPGNPAGHASHFDHGMNVFILFPEPLSEAMLERWLSHTGPSLKEPSHPPMRVSWSLSHPTQCLRFSFLLHPWGYLSSHLPRPGVISFSWNLFSHHG